MLEVTTSTVLPKQRERGGVQIVAGTRILETADSLVGDHATYNPRAILNTVCVCVCSELERRRSP